MVRLIRLLAATFVAVGLLAPTHAFAAFPTSATTSNPTPHVGEPVAFTATAECPTATCRYQWTARFYSNNRLVTYAQLGEGTTITYAFGQSAVGKTLYVSVKVTASNTTNNFAVATVYEQVQP